MIGDGDIAAILSSGDFDEEAVFDLDPGSLTVRGWFTSESDATTVYNVDIEAQKPSFMCSTDDIASVRNRMGVTIRATDYSVERVEQIGTGMSVVYLKT